VADASLVTEIGALEELSAEWDALAVACGAPFSTPAWMLSWWRHIASSDLCLRVVVVRANGRVIGMLPLHARTVGRSRAVRYALLAARFDPAVQPLALPGREYEVAFAAAELIEHTEPLPDRIDLGPLPAFSPWARAISDGWPGRIRPLSIRTRVELVPIVTIGGRTFDDWLGERDSRVRANSRRRRRRFVDQGGSYRFATPDTLSADLGTYAELHAGRWRSRGESRYVALGDRLVPFFEDVARPLMDSERFRLLMVEVGGRPICAEISVVAGGEVASLTVGWDEQYRELGPARLALLRSVEDACQRGERRIDLCWGRFDDKSQYTDAIEAVSWDTLLIPSGRLWRTLAEGAGGFGAHVVRSRAERIFTEPQLKRLRSLRATKQPD